MHYTFTNKADVAAADKQTGAPASPERLLRLHRHFSLLEKYTSRHAFSLPRSFFFFFFLRFILIRCIFSLSLPTWDDCIKARCLKFNKGIFLCIWKFAQSRIELAVFSYSLPVVVQKANTD